MNKRDMRYFKIARDYSLQSTFTRKKVRIGCIAVYKGSIISYGYNSDKSHNVQKHYDQFREFTNPDKAAHLLHAEIHCLLKIMNKTNIEWSKVHLYIYRSMTSKPFGMSRPCKACMALIRSLGIKTIYYTGDNSYIMEKLIY